MALAHVFIQTLSGVGELALIVTIERVGHFLRGEAFFSLRVMQPRSSREELANLVRCRTCGLQIASKRPGCFPAWRSRPAIPGATAPACVVARVVVWRCGGQEFRCPIK